VNEEGPRPTRGLSRQGGKKRYATDPGYFFVAHPVCVCVYIYIYIYIYIYNSHTHTHTHYVYIRENSSVAYSRIPCWNESQRWIIGYNKHLNYIVLVVPNILPQYIYIVLSGILLDVFIQMSDNNGDFKKEVLSHVSQSIPLQRLISPHSSEDFSSWKVTLITE
jgi:hypothetical protein